MATKGVFEFSHNNLRSKSFAAFDEMRKNGKFVDVVIQVDNETFPAHRLVLSAAIPYFQIIFDSDFSESRMKEITMKEIDPVTMKVFIDYAYTSKVKITQENVESLLLASKFLHIAEVSDGCCQFLARNFSHENVIGFEMLATSLNCTDLTASAQMYIRQNFDDVSQTPEFLGMEFTFVNNLIRRDDLCTAKEEKVFEAVIKWVKADPERTDLLPKLLTGVRMPLLSPDYLVGEVSKEELIRTSIPCRDLVDEVKHYNMFLREPRKCDSFTIRQRFGNAKKQRTGFEGVPRHREF